MSSLAKKAKQKQPALAHSGPKQPKPSAQPKASNSRDGGKKNNAKPKQRQVAIHPKKENKGLPADQASKEVLDNVNELLKLLGDAEPKVLQAAVQNRGEDNLVLCLVPDLQALELKRAAAPAGPKYDWHEFADAIVAHGGTRCGDSDYVFSFNDMPALTACSVALIAAEPWASCLPPAHAALVAATSPALRHLCSTGVLISQAAAAGGVVAGAYPLFLY